VSGYADASYDAVNQDLQSLYAALDAPDQENVLARVQNLLQGVEALRFERDKAYEAMAIGDLALKEALDLIGDLARLETDEGRAMLVRLRFAAGL